MSIARNFLLSLAASLLLFGMAFAQSNMPANSNSTMNGQTSATAGVPTADQNFMIKAAQGGMAEVELGQLAEQNAQSPEVKAFGQRMVNDHSKANDQLKQLASQQGVALPTGLSAKDQLTKGRLSSLHGEAFDKAYMKDMVTDHKKDIAEFKHESADGRDPALKQWAGQTLPTLESHLSEAEKVAPTVGVNMNGTGNNGMAAAAH